MSFEKQASQSNETEEEIRAREAKEDAEDAVEMKAQMDIMAKMKAAKGDKAGEEKWSKMSEGFDQGELSEEAAEDYKETLEGIEKLKIMKDARKKAEQSEAGEEEYTCDKCGTINSRRGNFCIECGDKIDKKIEEDEKQPGEGIEKKDEEDEKQPEDEKMFENIDTFEDLYEKIPEEGIKGSRDIIYSKEDLIKKIKGVSSLEPKVIPQYINHITRSGGLRDKVIELIDKNK